MPDPEAALTNPETVYAFVDTNTLIHFPFVNQIDWPKELGAKEVCLVFCFIVFEELDRIKDGMTKPGRRELARRVGKFLGELLGPAPLDTPWTCLSARTQQSCMRPRTASPSSRG